MMNIYLCRHGCFVVGLFMLLIHYSLSPSCMKESLGNGSRYTVQMLCINHTTPSLLLPASLSNCCHFSLYLCASISESRPTRRTSKHSHLTYKYIEKREVADSKHTQLCVESSLCLVSVTTLRRNARGLLNCREGIDFVSF